MDNESYMLTHDELVRIEALNAALEQQTPEMGVSAEATIERAERYEEYIKNGVIHHG